MTSATTRRSSDLGHVQVDRKTKKIHDGGTERLSDSNKTKISQLLNCQLKLHDSRDLDQEFSHAPTVGVLENFQQEGEGCGVPGDAFDGVERR